MNLLQKLILFIISAVLAIIFLQYLEVNILKVPYEQSVTKKLLVDPMKQLFTTIFQGISSPFEMIRKFFITQMPPAMAEYAGLMAFLTVFTMILGGIYIVWRVVR